MTDKNRHVTIYGAGMSGLVAAINLKKDGFDVTVHDREAAYGGDSMYNPSTHTTPIWPKETSDYIGIDISSCFYPVMSCPFYFHNTRCDAPVSGLYTVERGNRKTSLDTLLYDEAIRLGVEFRFNSALRGEDIDKLSPGTIIACGLTTEVYDMLDIPYVKWQGWLSRGDIGYSNQSWIWLDEGITEYGYLSSANNYYFNLLFSQRPVGSDVLERYKGFMKTCAGVEHDNWRYVHGAVPVASPANPQLFRRGLICCGTLSGYMDPFAWFGIEGGLISGRIAALAVADPERARREFERFSRYFKISYYFKNRVWYPVIRPRVALMEKALILIGTKRFSRIMAGQVYEERHLPFSIPGFAHLSCM